MQLSWGTVPEDQWNGIITGYMVQVEGPDTTPITTCHDQYSTFKEVSDLRSSTEYSFSVTAMTVGGSGPAISISFVMPRGGKASNYIYWHH